MAQPSPAVLGLMRQLLRLEAGDSSDPAALAAAVERVCEKLRGELEALIGPGGSSALLRRAIILAKRESPFLDDVNPEMDSIGGLQSLTRVLRGSTTEQAEVASRAVLGHLIGLLVELMGEDLGLRPIRKVWPDVASAMAAPSSTETERMTRKTAQKVEIIKLRTGVPGLDPVLGGGLPEYSFNLIAGEPGAGKTTLAQQIMFANTTTERAGIYFTVLGEPPIKMLRYQQQYTFFEPDKLGERIRFVNLSEEVLNEDLSQVLDRIVREVEEVNPAIVVVDSFRTVVSGIDGYSPGEREVQSFMQRLALHLTTWQVTSFLVGEYSPEDRKNNPVFTVADGIFWLSQVIDRNSVVRKLQVVKVRGQASMPGLHTFRITDAGVQVFPRIPEQQMFRKPSTMERLGTGVPGLDEAIGGGIPAGDAVMLTGPAGSGKTTFGTQFIAEGLRQGEAGVIAVFEEYPEEYLARASLRNPAMAKMVDAGKLKLIYIRPLDLSVDETLAEILDWVQRIGARRVVIDSLSGFEIALAPAFREDFRESLYRLVGALTATGVTVFMTAEVVEGFPEVRFTSEKVSFVTDTIIVQRYVEIRGQLRKVLVVIKMRGSDHTREFLTYELTATGAVVGGPLRDFHGILTGNPEFRARMPQSEKVGLTVAESTLLELLTRLDGAAADVLAARSGLPPEKISPALDRLVALNYAASTTDGDVTVYRALAQVGE